MQRVDSLKNTLMLGGIEGRRRRGWQRMRCLDGTTDSMDMSLSEFWNWWWIGRPGMLRFMGSQRVGHDWATELNWTRILKCFLGKRQQPCWSEESGRFKAWPYTKITWHLLPLSWSQGHFNPFPSLPQHYTPLFTLAIYSDLFNWVSIQHLTSLHARCSQFRSNF